MLSGKSIIENDTHLLRLTPAGLAKNRHLKNVSRIAEPKINRITNVQRLPSAGFLPNRLLCVRFIFHCSFVNLSRKQNMCQPTLFV